MNIKKICLILLIGLFSCNKEEKKSNNDIETKKTEVLEFEIVKPAELEKNVDDFFSNVSKIEIFAYLDRNKWDKSDNPDYRNPDYIKNNKIEIKDKYLRNRIVLSNSQIKELLVGFKKGYYDYTAACYDPRHAIIFYDKDDVLGWPLADLSARYANLVTDIEINAGGGFWGWLTSSWNPLSHNQYWQDSQFLQQLKHVINR